MDYGGVIPVGSQAPTQLPAFPSVPNPSKTNPVLSPLRHTLFVEPPASCSLAQSSGTSQARACSEVSSARAESVRAIDRKMWILRVGGCRLSRGRPKNLGQLKHRVLTGCSPSSGTVQFAVLEGMWPLGMALSGAFPGLCHSRTRGSAEGRDGEELGARTVHTPSSCSGAGLPGRGDISKGFCQQ